MYAAVGHMWNISITLIMPHNDPVHLFHDEWDDPAMVMVANGGPLESPCPSTHFCATKSRVVNQRVPGAELAKLTPKIYDSYDLATKVAKNCMEERLKRTAFDRLRQINFEIDTLDETIGELQQNLKKAKQTCANLEKDLLELGFNIMELRSLRRAKVVPEKYTPENVSATDTQGATAAPVYVPTPKEPEPMETEQSVADVEMPEVQEMPRDQTLQTGRTVSKKTLEAIGLAPDKWAQILEINKQAPQLPSLDPFDVSSGIPPLPETAALLPSVLPQVTLPAVPQTTTMPEVSQAVLSAVTQPLMTQVSQGMMCAPSQETVSATMPSHTFAPPAAPSTLTQMDVGATAFPDEDIPLPSSVIQVTVEMAIKSIIRDGGRFVCPFVQCKKSYAHKSDCNKHVKEHFKEKDSFVCEKCGTGFASAKNLLEHTHGVHLKGDFLYKCDKCPAGFYYNSHFSLHKRSCTAQPPVQQQQQQQQAQENE